MENKEVPDFRKLASKIDLVNTSYERVVWAKIVPLILGPYDDISLEEMKKLKIVLRERGYTNTFLVKDIDTKSNFEGKLDIKFALILKSVKEDGRFIIPLFYFPNNNENGRIGHYAELIDLISTDDIIPILSAGVFHHKEARMLHHARIFPHKAEIKCYEDYQDKAIEHVDKFFPLLERKIMLEKSINTSFSSKERGD